MTERARLLQGLGDDYSTIDLSKACFSQMRTNLFAAFGAMSLGLSGCAGQVDPSLVLDSNQGAQLSTTGAVKDGSSKESAKPLSPLRIRVNAMKHLSPAEAIEEFIALEGEQIALECKTKFVSDESESKLNTRMGLVRQGDSTFYLPKDEYENFPELHYEVFTPESKNQNRMLIICKKALPKDTSTIYGYLRDSSEGIVFICNGGLAEVD